ncbi:hypothetical protein ACFFMN_43295 [Planobispora siamensis]|nr:hypothetical protein [Planobispora siamensis]
MDTDDHQVRLVGEAYDDYGYLVVDNYPNRIKVSVTEIFDDD